MDAQLLEAFARGLGALPSAVEDVVRRGQHHFGDTAPDGETLTAWGAQLKTQCTHLFVPPSSRSTREEVAAKHGMSAALWESLSPEERSTRERALTPPVPRQKPGAYLATGDELKALEGKSPIERLTIARSWAQGTRG